MSTTLRRCMSLMLVLCMVLALVLVPSPIDVQAEAATVPSTLATYIQDACTLHCWNWSIANIKANLGLIASQGYSAIQISPMQEQKESSVNKPFENWWVVYQPISFNINTKPGNAIGTRDELVDLCEEAHKYDIKVIMDVVSNHMANNGTANTLNSLIPDDIRNDASCWHDYTINSWDYSDRYNITQYCMAGLPDLNTGSDKIQNYVLNMLKEYIDCGVDGFRFDAAKQIETPSDRSDFASDFWPTVVNGANEYAASTRGIYLYNYGELLENPDNGGQLSNSAYTPYISLTESVWSNDVRYRLEDKNASGLQQAYFKDVNSDKLVLWAESHDTFGDGSSVNSDPYVLFQAWALVASRAYTMSLYFPRANDMLYQEMGQIAKAGWSSDSVKAVNRFHNHFVGQSEYLTKDSTGNMYYNERGNSGVMIVNFSGGSKSIDIPVYAMASGTYYDQITGNQFTVSGGRLYGQMGDTGVACVYNPSSVSCSHASHGLDGYCYDCYAYVGHSSGTTCSVCGTASTRTIYFKNTDSWSSVYLYGWHDNNTTITSSWPGNKMTLVDGTTDIYSIDVPVTATNIIFTNNSGAQTANLVPSADNNTYDYASGFWSNYGVVDTTAEYYLFGNINGADYNDYGYKFVDGELTVTFDSTSYVYVIDSNGVEYMTNDWVGEVTSTTLYNVASLTAPNKLMVPGGAEVTLTVVPNADGTLTLSYTTNSCVHSWGSGTVTTAATCESAGVKTYTCSGCGNTKTETIAALGHNYVSGTCANCGETEPVTEKVIYFKNTAGWSTVNVYAWTGNTSLTGTWPGSAMTKVSGTTDVYSYSVPLEATSIIFNNGTSQTADLTIPTDSKNLYTYSTNSWSVYGEDSGSTTTTDYYLFGYINGANYGCEEDYTNMGTYKFVDGKLTVTFDVDSYIAVKTTGNAAWYMTKTYVSGTSGTFYNTANVSAAEKMLIPGGVEVELTLTVNSDDTLTVSYVTAECQHNYTAKTTEASCQAPGQTVFTCTLCGDSYTQTIPQTGHMLGGWYVRTAATCTTDGEEVRGCSTCDFTETQAIPATGHSYTSKVTAPTCTEGGYTTYTCSSCGNSYTGDTTAATGHSYDDGTVITAATCTVQSVTKYTCTECGDSYTVTSTALGHDYTSKVTTAATCTTNGVKTFTCSRCNDSYTEVIAATGHSYSNGKCTVCGTVDPNCTHSYTSEVTTAATCLGTGLMTYTCSKCGDVYTEEIPANGHDYKITVVAPTCENNGYTIHACNNCTYSYNDTAVNPIGHNYSSVVTAPTCTEKGYTTYTCANCGNVYTWNETAATGHSYVNGTCTGCGEADPDYTAPTVDYYLFGYINGANYACEGDWENLGIYKFVNGKLTTSFDIDSYVAIKTGDNANWYMTKAYVSTNTGTFYNTTTGTSEKMLVPGGVEVTFTLVENSDGSLTLSYETASTECTHSYVASETTAATCTTDGVLTYTCANCGDSYTESIPATGHEFSNGYCIVCGAADPDYTPADLDYYLFGYINGADYGIGDDIDNLGEYKFVDGKLTVKFTEESYVAVKTSDNASFYMTNGYVGSATSATLYKFTDPNSVSANKLMIPGGQTVTITLTENWDGNLIISYTVDTSDCVHVSHDTDGICATCGATVEHTYSLGVCTVCGAQDPDYVAYSYYLFGYINGANYGCEEDSSNLGSYKFVDGQLTVTFNEASYVGIKKVDPGAKFGAEVVGWYMTQSYVEADSATLYNTSTGASEKMLVPGGVEVTFTLTVNEDDTLTLSYTTAPIEVIDPGLTLSYPTLSFEDEIIYNVYFNVADTTSVVEMGLMVLSSRDDSATVDDALYLVPGYVTNGTVYLAKSEGVAAANMGDALYFKVYAKLTDGSYAYSTAGGYNAKAYANSILNGSNSSEMKALVVSMLNYGAEAQLYFGHKTDALVNSALTDAHKALVSAYDSTMMDAIVKADSTKTTDFVRVSSNFKQLYPSVSFDGAFAINFYCQSAITVDNGMTLYYWDMETMESVDKLSIDNATGSMEMVATGDVYWGQVPGIAAKQMDKTYYVTCVFESDGETITTGIIPYSLGKYCQTKADTDGDTQQAFAQATAVYGYYAKTYFASIA